MNALESWREELIARRARLDLQDRVVAAIDDMAAALIGLDVELAVPRAGDKGIDVQLRVAGGKAAPVEMQGKAPAAATIPVPEAANSPSAKIAPSDPAPAPQPATDPSGRFRLWSEEEARIALQRHREGRGIREIAEELGRPVEAARIKLRNLVRDAAENRPEPATGDEATATTRPAPAAMSMPRPVLVHEAPETAAAQLPAADGWSSIDDLQLVEKHTSGMRLDAVAEHLGRTRDDCLKRWRSLMAVQPGEAPTLDRQTKVLRALREAAA